MTAPKRTAAMILDRYHFEWQSANSNASAEALSALCADVLAGLPKRDYTQQPIGTARHAMQIARNNTLDEVQESIKAYFGPDDHSIPPKEVV